MTEDGYSAEIADSIARRERHQRRVVFVMLACAALGVMVASVESAPWGVLGWIVAVLAFYMLAVKHGDTAKEWADRARSLRGSA